MFRQIVTAAQLEVFPMFLTLYSLERII